MKLVTNPPTPFRLGRHPPAPETPGGQRGAHGGGCAAIVFLVFSLLRSGLSPVFSGREGGGVFLVPGCSSRLGSAPLANTRVTRAKKEDNKAAAAQRARVARRSRGVWCAPMNGPKTPRKERVGPHGDGGAPPDLRGPSLRFQDGQSRTAHPPGVTAWPEAHRRDLSRHREMETCQ